MPSYQYRDSRVKDKTVSPTVLSLIWESPYLGKTWHDAWNGLKAPTAPISTLRRSGHPYAKNRIQWEYNILRGENRGPFKGQQASGSNPVMETGPKNLEWEIQWFDDELFMFAVVNFDALAQASDFRIERRQFFFLCWMQDSKLGSLRHQIASRLNAHSQTGLTKTKWYGIADY